MTDIFIKAVFIFGFEQIHVEVGMANLGVAGGALRVSCVVEIHSMEAVICCGFLEILVAGKAARVVDKFLAALPRSLPVQGALFPGQSDPGVMGP